MSKVRTALSFSRLDTYLQCPRKYESMYITKDYPSQDDSPALISGKYVHSQLEEWMKAALKDKQLPNLNAIAKNAVPIMTNILENYTSISPENQLAVNDKWEPVGWFDKDVYYRAIVDLMALKSDSEAIVIDYKTGKVRDYEAGEYAQLNLTASMLFCIYPQLEVIKCYYLFVEHKKTCAVTFNRSTMERMREPFIRIHDEINSTEFFDPKVNKYCRWCQISPDKCELKR